MVRGIRAVTVSTADLTAAHALYEGLLGMQARAEWALTRAEVRVWGLPDGTEGRAVWLEQPQATEGAVRLVRFDPVSPVCATDGARPYDHGLVKNLDFFTDDVAGAFARFTAAGHRFLAPPVSYPVGWGGAVVATEAHLPTADGVKFSLASVTGAPRKAFGDARHDAPFTEVAAATQIVADFDRSVTFYRDAFDCVPAAPTVVDDPALVAALHLPARTRLRICFIGPPLAVGGKVGLVSYEGEGVGDARSLALQCRPPHRGAIVLTMEVSDVDHAHARALAAGATGVAAPADEEAPPLGAVRLASVRSPDGILLEIVGPRGGDYRPALALAELPAGALRGLRLDGLGRVALANVDGQVFALEDRCPHLGGPLSKGVLNGRLVTCPWHGWTIDVTSGRVTGGDGLGARVCPARVAAGEVRLPAAWPGRGEGGRDGAAKS